MFDFFSKPVDFIIHIDKYLGIIIEQYGLLTYLVLFAIIALETGFVLAPFLPGDSLLFVAGAFAAKGILNVFLLFFLLAAAAIIGDSVNYWIGKTFGVRLFQNSRFFKQSYLDKTQQFYAKHGGKTIIFARFVPVIRTFAPFVAGVGSMEYLRFLSYNVVGGIIWVALFVFGGYYFGGLPFVEDNLTLVILIIIIASFIPPVIEMIRQRSKKN